MRSGGRWAQAGVVMLLGLRGARDVYAWGDTGHNIICEIAFQELNPQARAQVKQLLQHAPDFTLFSKACTWPNHPRDWFWAACEQEGLPIGLLAAGHIADLDKIAERHPGQKLHIDHYARGGGGSAGTDDAAFADLDEMLALAKYPNVAVKLSGGPSYSSRSYPYRNIHKYIRQIYDAFGPQRCFWGTDITRILRLAGLETAHIGHAGAPAAESGVSAATGNSTERPGPWRAGPGHRCTRGGPRNQRDVSKSWRNSHGPDNREAQFLCV